MANSKKPERQMIVDSVKRRPYGAKLSVVLDESTGMKLDGEVCLLTTTEFIVRMRPSTDKKENKLGGSSVSHAWDVYIEGFATAGEAEKIGLEVTLGILWGAISERYAVQLQYLTPLPCVVYDRTKSGEGIKVTGYVSVIIGKSLNTVVNAIDEALSSPNRMDKKLLLAMELFASARLEMTERTRFIGLISSLEPLVEQKEYGEEVSKTTNRFKEDIRSLGLPPHIEASIIGRIDTLSTESVLSAIRRLIKECLPDDDEALEIIEEAYNLRSRILHEGTTDADLNLKSQEMENVIRRVIAARIGLKLRV